MILKKFVSIKGVGRFHDSKAAGDVELRKLTLLYGENGRGKTTLCAILRSLESGIAAYITGRQTLGTATSPSIRILIDAATPFTSFSEGAWNQTLPQLRIFDQHYISENVYLGEGVGPEQKRNLYKIIVGKDAVAQAQWMDQLVADIRKSSAAIRDASKGVESHLVPGPNLQDLIAAKPDPEISNKITKLEAHVLNASATVVVQKSVPFGLITLPAKPTGLAVCFGKPPIGEPFPM